MRIAPWRHEGGTAGKGESVRFRFRTGRGSIALQGGREGSRILHLTTNRSPTAIPLVSKRGKGSI